LKSTYGMCNVCNIPSRLRLKLWGHYFQYRYRYRYSCSW